MHKWMYPDGTPYDGPVVFTPDNRVFTGETRTRDSVKVIPYEEAKDGSKRSGELHKTSDAPKAVQPNKGGNKGRKSGPVVSKKSATSRSKV